MAERVVLPRERQDQIRRLLQEKQFVTVRELAEGANVSSMTIRRDLEALEAEGVVSRVFGGARLALEPVPELLYTERMGQNRPAKEKIAALAVNLVRNGDILALDGSTSAVYLARQLRGRPITVVTNNLLAANELAGSETNVFIPGGMLRNATRTLVGDSVERALREINVNRVFFSASGLHHEVGFSDSNQEEVSLKRALFSIAAQRVALIDASKFGRVSLHKLIATVDVQMLLTDAAPDAELAAMLGRAGVEVRVVGR